jgi:hypothetical protein
MANQPSHCTTGEPGELYTVRLYDGFDYEWMDILTGVPYEEARELWDLKTNNGTEKTRYNDIDYYDIFPANTQMLHSESGRLAPLHRSS